MTGFIKLIPVIKKVIVVTPYSDKAKAAALNTGSLCLSFRSLRYLRLKKTKHKIELANTSLNSRTGVKPNSDSTSKFGKLKGGKYCCDPVI